MRISDHRYNRDRTRFDLALRMMSHQARTLTIKRWTGLSEDRIRKLFKSYWPGAPEARPRRHRGRAPRQEAYFLQTAAFCFEATTLASLLHAAGLVEVDPPQATAAADSRPAADLHGAQTFCEAYEAYLRLCPAARFTFEHACFLLLCLRKHERIKLTRCRQCGRLYLTETCRLQAPSCGCGRRRCGWPRRGRLPKSIIQAYDDWAAGPERGERRAAAALQSS